MYLFEDYLHLMTLKDFLDKIMVVYVCPACVSDHLILGENYFNSKNI